MRVCLDFCPVKVFSLDVGTAFPVPEIELSLNLALAYVSCEWGGGEGQKAFFPLESVAPLTCMAVDTVDAITITR